MIVMGIDPGYATVGWGVLEAQRGQLRALGWGTITTRPGVAMALRLLEIHKDMTALLERYRPEAVAMEELYFSKNVTTGIAVAQARGVLTLACAQCGQIAFEYPPNAVKLAIVGYGGAEKKQVMEMTRLVLKLDAIPRPDDAADALAIAVCHAHTARL